MGSNLLLDEDEIVEAARQLGETLASYQASLSERPVFPDLDRVLIRRIAAEPLPEQGQPWQALFREFRDEILPNSTQIAHPRYLAYVLSSPHGLAPFIDALASALNQGCSLWELSPIANAIEQKVLAWFRDLFAMPETGAGYLTSGGSMANLTALTAARDWRLGDAARSEGLQGNQRKLVLYTSSEAHTSIAKAVAILGLGVENLRAIPSDDEFRIRMDLLGEAIAQDRADGLDPFCVVGAAGTINTGAIDPLAELAALCRDQDLWLHVDGAYGAFGVLSERLAPRLREAGLADSLTLDPHKLLFNSLEVGCVLFREPEHVLRSFAFASSYLAKAEDPDLINFSEYGPELSRSFKALKVWWGLRTFGRSGYRETLDQILDLALYMGRRIEAQPALELAAPITFTAVCFRASGLDDAAQTRIQQRVVASGAGFIGPARIAGRTCLRACMTNLRTREADIDAVLDAVVREAQSDG
ncbi:MAG: hypothetical protein GY725_00345 [bacterium]|nr:hypothetical protein [bacterium]